MPEAQSLKGQRLAVWNAANPERYLANIARWQAANPEKRAASDRKRRSDPARLAYKLAWDAANKERRREQRNVRQRQRRCKHHWLLDPPGASDEVKGRCTKCTKEKAFLAWDDAAHFNNKRR